MHVVSTNQIIDILHFNDKDCYLPFFGLISPGQIDKTYATKTDNTRGNYQKYTDQERFQVGKYAAEYDIISSVRKYRPNFPKIKESTITEFKRKYEVQMKHSKNNAGQDAAEGKTAEKSSRSLLSGKLDGMVQTYIRSASNCGAFVPR